MPKKIKSKYTVRADGRLVTTRTYDGKRVPFYGHSDEEIEAKIAAYESKLNPPTLLKDVAERWWAEKEPALSPNTVAGYRAQKNALISHFGDRAIKDITSHEIVDYLQEMSRLRCSQKKINNYKSVCKMVFDFAFMEGEIDLNPVNGIPIVKGTARTPRKATPDEDIKIIEATKTQNNFARMTYFMLYTGCRRGEAAALQFKDIDRKNKVAHINKAIAYGDTRKPVLKCAKTEAGMRDVLLLDNVLAILPKGKPNDFVFFPEGLPTKTHLEAGLRKYQDDNGLHSTAHQLRHAFASMCLEAELAPAEAKALLGHANISVTMDIYTHVRKKQTEIIRGKLNKQVKVSNEDVKKSKPTANAQ